MSKKFLVNGVELICVDETKFDDVRKQFKENVTIDDLESWESKKEMEQYTATVFIEKARFYLSQSPPDLVQSSEKIWFAAVYAVKKLFLSSGGINLKSHKALNYFCRFALTHSGLTADRIIFLIDCWTNAEKMHQDVYGSWNFRSNEYVQIITDVETFVKEFDNFDQRKLWDEFERTFIVGTEQNITVKKKVHTVDEIVDSLNESFEDFVIESGNEDEEFENNENDELERNENADLLDTDAEWSDEEDGDEARGDEQNTSAWSYKIQRPVRPQFSGEHGANLNMLKKCKTDLDYYNLFFPDSITSLILSQSDLYGSTKTQNFMSICKDELMIFLAMLLQMGYMCRPKMEDYWTTDIAFGGVSIFKDVMPKKRFKDILRSLHFADNNNNSGSRLYKIEKLVEIFNNVCQSLLRPGEKVCIDESIIPFRGRLAFCQYIPNKRHRYGIKLFKLCTTSGYTYNTMIYCGKSKNTTCSVGEAVVTEFGKGPVQ